MTEKEKKCQVLEGHWENGSLSPYLPDKYPKYNKDVTLKKCNNKGKYNVGYGFYLCTKHRRMLNADGGPDILKKRDQLLNTIMEYIENQYPDKKLREKYLEQLLEMETYELGQFEKELTALRTLKEAIISKHLE